MSTSAIAGEPGTARRDEPRGERTLTQIAADIISNLGSLLRSEIRLARSEARREIADTGAAVSVFVLASVLGFFALSFVAIAMFFGLSMALPYWAAALIVAVIMAIAAWIASAAGRARWKKFTDNPGPMIRAAREHVI